MSKLDIPIGEPDAASAYQVIPTLSGINLYTLLRQAAGENRDVTIEHDALVVRRQRSMTYLLRSEQICQMVNRCTVVDRKGRTEATTQRDADILACGALWNVFDKSGPPYRAGQKTAPEGVLWPLRRLSMETQTMPAALKSEVPNFMKQI